MPLQTLGKYFCFWLFTIWIWIWKKEKENQVESFLYIFQADHRWKGLTFLSKVDSLSAKNYICNCTWIVLRSSIFLLLLALSLCYFGLTIWRMAIWIWCWNFWYLDIIRKWFWNFQCPAITLIISNLQALDSC